MAVDREIERIDVYVESREKENEPLGERVKAREREREKKNERENRRIQTFIRQEIQFADCQQCYFHVITRKENIYVSLGISKT